MESAQAGGRGAAKWVIAGVLAIALIGVGSWCYVVSAAHAAEQQAINELRSAFSAERVLIVNADTEPVEEYQPDDVDLVVTVAWNGPLWLRAPLEALGGPLLDRVQAVKIYDPDVNESVMSPLTQFKLLEAFHLTPNVELSREPFADLVRAAPDVTIYIEHDNPDYDREPERRGDADEDDPEDATEAE